MSNCNYSTADNIDIRNIVADIDTGNWGDSKCPDYHNNLDRSSKADPDCMGSLGTDIGTGIAH